MRGERKRRRKREDGMFRWYGVVGVVWAVLGQAEEP